MSASKNQARPVLSAQNFRVSTTKSKSLSGRKSEHRPKQSAKRRKVTAVTLKEDDKRVGVLKAAFSSSEDRSDMAWNTLCSHNPEGAGESPALSLSERLERE